MLPLAVVGAVLIAAFPPSQSKMTRAPLAALGPRAPLAALGPRGVQLHPLWDGESVATFDRELDTVRAAGGDTVRIDIGWSNLEQAGKGAYDDASAAKADTFLRDARARGIKVIATLWSTPCWASSAPADIKQGCRDHWWERGVDRYPPNDARDYADAAAWVAARWGSQLQALELWNEPNSRSFFNSAHAASDYAALVRTAYPRIKAADQGLTVVAGSLQWADARFLGALYAAGLAGSYDAISIHPYDDPGEHASPGDATYSFADGVPAIHRLMVAHSDARTPLWLTEFGWATCPSSRSALCVSPRQQAQNLTDAFHQIARWPYVQTAIYYELRDESASSPDFQQHLGLLSTDFTPKAAYAAFAGQPNPPAA